MLSEITQEPIQYISPGIAEFNGQMKKVGVPEPIIGMLSMFGEAISNGEFDQQTNDLETILGRRTQIFNRSLLKPVQFNLNHKK